MKRILSIFALAALAGCSGNHSTQLITVELKKSYPKLEIPIQELAGVEYIPLETNDDLLVDADPQIFYADREYLMLHQSGETILIYDRRGRAVRSINRLGNGPQEYGRLSRVCYDPSGGEIFVCDYSRSRIMVYDITGAFIRQFGVPAGEQYTDMKVWDRENLIVYSNPRAILSPESENFTKTVSVISQQDGSRVEEADIKFDRRRFSIRVTYNNGDISSVRIFSLLPIHRSGKDFLLSEISADTVFRLSHDMKLTPAVVRRPSVANAEQIFLLALGETPRYLFMSTVNIEEEENSRVHGYLVCDKREGQIYAPAIYNEEYSTGELFRFDQYVFNGDITPANSVCSVIDAFELVRANARGEVRGRLKDIADGLAEDDNPVVMIATFKE